MRWVVAVLAPCVLLLWTLSAHAAAEGQLFATQEEGYGRLILTFPGRNDLPPYTMRVENGVLSLVFSEQVAVMLPDVGKTMPDYLAVARIDPDGKGIRLGLKKSFNFNRMEAGEQLFIDLMPQTWQGMPPALPQDVVDKLAERARVAAIEAERQRKAAGVEELDPQVAVRIGRNPTFMRVQFDWTVPTDASFIQEGELGLISFEWPVEVDLRELMTDLPPEIASLQTGTSDDGAVVTMVLAEGVTPRFYQNSASQYVLDVDIAGVSLPSLTPEAVAEQAAEAEPVEPAAPQVDKLYPSNLASTITPFVSVLGSTVRVVFPFEQDTPAAVFRRGDTVWMIFDTVAGINAPAPSSEFDALANEFDVVASGDTQLVRLELSQDRLATLGSEGMAWVLSLGDIMLTPTEPIDLSRRRDAEGDYEMVADMARPGRVHDFRDPLVGDVLKVVTAYPPARGLSRTLDYVDFAALRSVHGLVVKPETTALSVALDNDLAVISTPGGLTVSAVDGPRMSVNGAAEAMRTSFIDLKSLETSDYGAFSQHADMLMAQAAEGEGKQRDKARLDLIHYLLANQFAIEAIGVLAVLEAELTDQSLTRDIRLALAIAQTQAHRTKDALAILNSPAMGQDVDALLWRTVARVDDNDFKGARQDAIAAMPVAASYPNWVSNRFTLAAARAAIETNDVAMAEGLLGGLNFAGLGPEETSLFHLLSGRVDELRGRLDEAIDTYGQVIAEDIRPTRAEAVFRTLKLLDGAGKLNLERGAATLSAESMLWRGNPLEAAMQAMLADIYFRNGDYRQGFEAVRQAVATYPESPPITALGAEAQDVFSRLFLEGEADTLGPVEALALYYDFRQLTPPGARGDEMIRNLARRLVRVDLLPQAADLLQYQLNNRLTGVARTQIAADLSVIYLADRKPQEALRVLNATRLPGIPESLARQRRILEARAMLDGGRDELALDLVRDLSGRDVDLMRIDANWRARRYVQAAEMLETLYANETELSQPARMGILKAAVGYALANDGIGMNRLRSKFGDAMVTSPEWPMFDLVTGSTDITSLQFKTVASQVADVEGINAFLDSYRETYGPSGAMAPLVAAEPGAPGVASAN